MRPEKAYLVKEASDYLSRSEYVFLADYQGINAEETTELRKKLAERGAEFHVVKNSSLRLAAKEQDLPDISEHLSGHTAIVVGGEDASGVAKALGLYYKDNNKVTVKGGALGDRLLTADEIKTLAKLPGLEVLRAQLLSLLNTSASQFVGVLGAPARGLVTVLKAKSEKG
ncbi:MAG TPA: 50S ribosomal protein L10 [Opitutae bacterium]|nr:50S ribosomal protein L10 [Opitutae bacterium]|tara:strand:- start:235 stop:744 length:510 start_codon:yes stop_codon:yes gene_type:complete